MATRGVRTTAGSKILGNYVPPYDCTAVARMESAGAVVLGKLNCDEFAMGSSNENSAWRPVRNPRDLSRVPGGSSGGSAAAVAARHGGGHARVRHWRLDSAAGVVLRRGGSDADLWPRVALWIDCVRLVARPHRAADEDREGCRALVLRTIAGRDPMDSTSADMPVPDYVAELEKPVRGLKLGVPKEYFGEGLDDDVRKAVEAAIQKLAKLGCEIVPISLPHTKYAIPTYYIVATAEASSNLARFDGVRYGFRASDTRSLSEMYRRSRDQGFGAEVKRRIILGTYALSAGYYDAYYLKAQKVRTLLAQDFAAAFKKVDAIVTPTSPTAAFKLGEKVDDPLAMYLADIFTVTANLAGICGVSIPCGETKEKLPIGLQILGKHFDEATILRVGHAFEQS